MWRLLTRAPAPLWRMHFSDTWAALPTSAGLKTLLPVPTFESKYLSFPLFFPLIKDIVGVLVLPPS
ncbi:mitochondrial ribosomal protein L16, isoform CRA_c [Rattus norvegicus]|uniref:Mitochondrial ribosomal protein L16, isoform CRA_c n=1 Tax=Rattus norvegicus TaxID=10116 RepID=A6I0B0_RAT|nr:mitochondrial ribosomal protein L16, isoform CRA_c [Rattus norvegicus]